MRYPSAAAAGYNVSAELLIIAKEDLELDQDNDLNVIGTALGLTETGSQASPQTLNLSLRLLNCVISSSVSSQPSNSKLLSMRAGVTDLGITLVFRCMPHNSLTYISVSVP